MTIVEHFRFLMEMNAYAMTAEITNHAITILLAMLLDGMADVAYKAVRLGSLHTNLQTLLSHAYQLLLLRSSLAAYNKHTAGISIVTVHDGSHVHIDDVALFENILFLRNTVTNYLVDRSTNTLRIAFIVEAGRNRIVILAVLHAKVIDFLCIDTRADHLSYSVETTGINDTALADALNLLRSLNQVAGRNQLTLIFPKHHLLVELSKRLSRQAMPSLFLNHCLVILIFATAKVHHLLQNAK